MPVEIDGRRFYTSTDIMSELGISRCTVDRALEDGRIEPCSHRIGQHQLWLEEQMERVRLANVKPRPRRRHGKRREFKHTFWTDDKLEQLRSLYSIPTTKEIADFFGVGVSTIQRVAAKHGIPRVRRIRQDEV